MIKNYILILTLFVMALGSGQQYTGSYGGAKLTAFNIVYTGDNCELSYFKATFSEVYKERNVYKYEIQLQSKYDSNWRTIKNVYPSSANEYTIDIGVKGTYISRFNFYFRVKVVTTPQAYMDGARYLQGRTTRVEGKPKECPKPVLISRPNLAITSLIIENNGKSYDYFKSQTPNIIKDKKTKFKITFTNNGKITANSCEYRMYISPYNDLIPNTNQRLFNQFGSYNVGSLNPNSSKLSGPSYTFHTYEGPLVLTSGTYYLYIEIDPKNKVKETDESTYDNVIKFPINFRKTAKVKPIGSDPCETCKNTNQESSTSSNTRYEIQVYDMTGQKVKSEKVRSIEEENKAIENLPKNLYIIKSKKGDRKVYY